jgi:D-alanyl-D-alanine carboxypeptidase
MDIRAITGRTAALSGLIGALLLAPSGPAPAAADTTNAQAAPSHVRTGQSQLEQLLDTLVAAGTPGAAVRIDDGRGVWTAASGLADVSRGRPMRPVLSFRAGSLTKPMVATVVLQLVGENRLALTDTVDDWLPGILPYGNQVTVRQLLTMTSGVPEYLRGGPAIAMFGPTPGRLRSWTPRELVALVADRPPTFAAGTGFEYSNTNYVLAGLIVEAATGTSLRHQLTQRVIRPLHLHNTWFPINNPIIAGADAHGYSLPVDPVQGPVEGGRLRDVTLLNPSVTWAAGNIVSDLGDLTRFLRALLAGRLLPPALLAQMLTWVDTGDPEAGYGMGLETIHTSCGSVIGHSGDIAGFRTLVLATEGGRRQFALMANQYIAGRAASQAFPQAAVALMRRLFPDAACATTPPSALAGHAANSLVGGILVERGTRPVRAASATSSPGPSERDRQGEIPLRSALGKGKFSRFDHPS